MSDSAAEPVSRPPYVSYSTFRGFLSRLKETVVPAVIDNSAMGAGMAGGTRSHLRATLGSLRLVDDESRPTEALRALVEALDTDEWPQALQKHLIPAYRSILNGLGDLATATHRQLEVQFRAQAGASGQVLVKGIRFFLQAAREADMEISPHIKIPNAPSNGTAGNSGVTTRRRRRPRGPAKQAGADVSGEASGDVPKDFVAHTFPLRKGTAIKVHLPEDLTPAEVERVCQWLKTLPLPDEEQ
jgi:hypothetical protein